MAYEQLHHNRVSWIDIVHPTPQDVEKLRLEYPYIHPLNLEDIRSVIERPKIDVDDDYIFVVMHFPLWDRKRALSRSAEVNIILGRGYVVTVHDAALTPLTNLFNNCRDHEDDRQRYMGRGANDTFYAIIDQLVDHVLPMLRKVEIKIRTIEEAIFDQDMRRVIQQITLVRRDIISLRRIIKQQVPIVEQLETMDHPILREDLEEYFGDIADHLYKARDIVEEDYEVVNAIADTVDMLANHRTNQVVQILTVFSAVMLPLTLLSSIYGMNISLPFENETHAFWLLLAAMIVITVLMLLYFKRRRWL
jgi:magnesium transporter